ncbi:MAG: hypothetical protein ABSH50_03690 [Bryobacteraceae bacterium]|jgi:uncharacterized membrane protein
MAFCPNCGAAVEGRYCAKCGTAVDAAAPAATVTAPGASTSGLSENAAAALCYVLGLITGIIFLVLEPYSKNKLIRFHAFQSIFLHVGVIIIWVAIRIVLPWQMWYLAALINLAFFALWIYLLVQTYQGKKVVLPVIGDLASKQA